MANVIKDFFKKKKLDAKFKMAGSGHRLTDNQNKVSAASTAQSSRSTTKTTSGSSNRAGAAAFDRIQKQQSSHSKTNTLENITQEERRKITEQYKEKERIESCAKEETKHLLQQEKLYNEFDSSQLFSCPAIGLDESQPIDNLIEQINDYIQINFADDLTLMSVVTIINCNFSLTDDYQQRVEQCISILDKIVSNLANSSPEDRNKFKKIRKAKIERKVLDLKGGQEFLVSIGFELDSDEEWFVYKGDESEIFDQMNYYKDVLNNVQQFPIILDRQHSIVESDSTQTDQQLSDEFFRLTSNELTHELQALTEKRELEETLRTKAMREERHKKINTKYTRLRFKLPNGAQMDATFGSRETLVDVKNWLSQYLDSKNDFRLKCGPDVYTDEHHNQTLQQLNLSPTAALLII